MPEIIVRQWFESEAPQELATDFNYLQDLQGAGESTIVDIFDNDGNLYYHGHDGLAFEGEHYPYPKRCHLSNLFSSCDLAAIEKNYKDGK